MRTVIALLVLVFMSVFNARFAFAADDPLAKRAQVEQLAAELAAELSRLCPSARPGDEAAFDRCRNALFEDSLLKRSLSPYVLWGRVKDKDLSARLKETNLTQFAPDVLSGMYVPLFMFNGKHAVEYQAEEGMFRVRLDTAFRNRLPPGQFPYPFWHEESKWSTYQGANAMLLWVDPKTLKVKVAQFTDRGPNKPIVSSEWVRAPEFDGKWMWTDADGHEQPVATLFDGLFRSENPYAAKLDAAYRNLALKLRDAQCLDCHVPNNPEKMKKLVLLQSPAHAAGEIKRVMEAVRKDKMPLDQTGIEQPLDEPIKKALLEQGAAFEALVDAAKGWEAARRKKFPGSGPGAPAKP
jgi:hypothetical protein